MEGIVREHMARRAAPTPEAFGAMRKQLAASFKTVSLVAPGTPLKPEEYAAARNYYNLAAIETFYARFTPGSGDPAKLNRHAVAHGLSVAYGSIENSSRAFLLLDLLHGLLASLK